jgi:uncharacterized protein (TIGR00297 family)
VAQITQSRQSKLAWQSKLVLLLVLPFTGASLVLQAHWWALHFWPVAVWALGLSLLFGLGVLALGAATPEGAFAGAAITACLTFSTATFTPIGSIPYAPWHSALLPVLAVFLLTFLATRMGRERKEQLGTAERRRGRNAAQVAANLGVAAIACSDLAQSGMLESGWIPGAHSAPVVLFAVGLAALAEAAADTVSSEVGSIFGGQPRLITTWQPVEAGTDGAVSLAGTLAGVLAAVVVAAIGAWALGGGAAIFWIGAAAGFFGFFVDSLLGATLERRGWLNNDAVNFLSTAAAAGFALVLLTALSHLGAR